MQGPQGADTNSRDRQTCMSLGCATAGAPHRAPSRSEVWDSQPRRRRQGDPDSVRASSPWMPHPLQPMPSSCLLCEPMCLHSMPCGRHAAAVIPVPLSLEGGWMFYRTGTDTPANVITTGLHSIGWASIGWRHVIASRPSSHCTTQHSSIRIFRTGHIAVCSCTT